MRKWMLAASAAALAVSAPALAQGHGGGHGGGKDKADHSDRGGPTKAQRGGGDRSLGRADVARVERDRGDRGARADFGEKARGKPAFAGMRDDDRRAPRSVRVEHGDRDVRGKGPDKVRDIRIARSDRDEVRVRLDDDGDRIIRRAFDRDLFPGRGKGLIAGCPPGLAMKDNGCLPPGQAKKLIGSVLPAAYSSRLIPTNYRSWYPDDDDYLYRAADGYIYRVDRDRNLIDGIIPMLAGGYGGYANYYSYGDQWPSAYNFYNVPSQYRNYWADQGDDCYRYDGFGAIYEVNCKTNLVDSIVALVAGDLGVGNRLPMGYDVYNVPYQYRANYYDSPDAWYRYNDGYIYRVDPKTRLITAVIEALI